MRIDRRFLSFVATAALLASMIAASPALANPPAPEDQAAPALPNLAPWPVAPASLGDRLAALSSEYAKPIDQPNPRDKQRMIQRQQSLEGGLSAQAADLALSGTDRVLVILAEFAGTDTFTWTAGVSQWDPKNTADASGWAGNPGDCSKIINQTTVFTYSGPLHNQIPRPISQADRSGDTIWTPDFDNGWYNSFMFGNGVVFDYDRVDGSHVHDDFTGKSVKNYYLDMSAGQYSITGDVIGWVPLPHSEMWYGADSCPGARSVPGGSGLNADTGIPGAGTPESLVIDALNAVNAISNTIPGFNWSNYDKDGDGVIDRLWIVHAGYGEEDSTTLLNRTSYGEGAVWSHSSSIPLHQVAPGISAGPYIMMPENGGIGVFAHESGHNLGADDLYAYSGGETSAGFWTLMADDWTGYPLGFQPPAVDPWHLDDWGWLDPKIITDSSQTYIVKIGQASRFPDGQDIYRAVKIPLATGSVPLPVQPIGQWDWWGGKQDLSNGKLTTKTAIDIPPAGATLSFSLAYGIEPQWDFLWVQASSDQGVTWTTLTNAHTVCTHDPSWIGGQNGFPDDLCGHSSGGFTGFSAGFPNFNTETFDLAAFAGQHLLLRFWYMTDWGTTFAGPFIDNVKVTSGPTNLFADDMEAGDGNWTATGAWARNTGIEPSRQNYYLQWRNTNANGGYDSSLGDPRYRYGPANTGLLVWYNDNFYTDNEIAYNLFDSPSVGPKGRMLVVDSHPEPYRDPYLVGLGYNNEGGNVPSRSLMRDAPFTLQPTVSFAMTAGNGVYQTASFPSRPAVSTFNDALGYYPGAEYVSGGPGSPSLKWITKQWDASVVLPGTGDYPLRAPGYTGNEEFRYDCAPATGGLSCYGLGSGLGYPGGTGNPGDYNAQNGWRVQLIEEAPDHTWAKVRISPYYASYPTAVSALGRAVINYTVVLDNPTTLAQTRAFTFTLDSDLTHGSHNWSGGTAVAPSTYGWSGQIAPSSTVTFTLTATVPAPPGGTTVTHTTTLAYSDSVHHEATEQMVTSVTAVPFGAYLPVIARSSGGGW